MDFDGDVYNYRIGGNPRKGDYRYWRDSTGYYRSREGIPNISVYPLVNPGARTAPPAPGAQLTLPFYTWSRT